MPGVGVGVGLDSARLLQPAGGSGPTPPGPPVGSLFHFDFIDKNYYSGETPVAGTALLDSLALVGGAGFQTDGSDEGAAFINGVSDLIKSGNYAVVFDCEIVNADGPIFGNMDATDDTELSGDFRNNFSVDGYFSAEVYGYDNNDTPFNNLNLQTANVYGYGAT
jgi:hypothetical protein